MFDKITLKQLSLFISGLILFSGLSIGVGLLYLERQNALIKLSWVNLQKEYSEKTRLVSMVNEALGYGGMIHHLKNLVLRKNLNDAPIIREEISAVKFALQQYEQRGTDSIERAAIRDIERTLEKYLIASEKVIQSIKNGENAGSIDNNTKVDDTLAIRALAELRGYSNNHIEDINLATRFDHINMLRATLGYGGMIHNFKNYVIRHDKKYYLEFKKYFASATGLIKNYESRAAIESEKIALKDIFNTLQLYDSNIEKVSEMIVSGSSVEAIDEAVKVNDELALRGLQSLDLEVFRQKQKQTSSIGHSFNEMSKAFNFMIVGALVITAATILICVWIITKYIATPIRGISETMLALSRGEPENDIGFSKGTLEVDQMLTAVETFRQNEVLRKKAEQDLKETNTELTHQLEAVNDMRANSEEQTSKALRLAENLVNARDEALIATRTATDEKNRAKSIVDTVSDAIITIDQSGNIQTFNPAAERLFEYREKEVQGKNVKILVPSPFKEQHDDYLSAYMRNGYGRLINNELSVANRRELYAVKKSGDTFPIEISIGATDLGGRKLFIGVIRDISEAKRIERLKNEFVATVSHELRTPLTALKGSLGLISSGALGDQLSEKSLQLFNLAERNADRLTLLVNDILDLEKMDADKMAFQFEVIDANKLLDDAIEFNQHYASENGIQIEKTDERVDAKISVDEKRIAQVFANLISNAAKFSPEGSDVSVGVQRHDGKIRFYVQDHGIGIPEQFREHIFERFSQNDSSNLREVKGTGLGMAISKSIIDKHYGTIDFVSEMDRGSTFYFDLPEYIEPAKSKA